jgi:hypothetical protein
MSEDNKQPKTESVVAVGSKDWLGGVTWEDVITAGQIVAAAHSELIKASDDLSGKLRPMFWGDDVLKQCLPLKAGERRNSQRILDWLDSKKTEIEDGLEAQREYRVKESNRERLLEKLKLTEEEKQLLGI